jgi:hypothetical protein
MEADLDFDTCHRLSLVRRFETFTVNAAAAKPHIIYPAIAVVYVDELILHISVVWGET